MKIKLQGKRVAVEKIKKQEKGATGGIILPDSEEYLGYVRYVGEETKVEVGQKVYFSTSYQQVRMNGTDLCVMDDSQIFAIVED